MFTERKSAGLSSIRQGTNGENGSALRASLSVFPLPEPAGGVLGPALDAAAEAALDAAAEGAVEGALLTPPTGAADGALDAGAVVAVLVVPPHAATRALRVVKPPSAAAARSNLRRLRRAGTSPECEDGLIIDGLLF
jgi:hypothetical protein